MSKRTSRSSLPNNAVASAFAACVFHHIEPRQHERLFTEIRRVLKPSGYLMIYEHNPFNPLTLRAVNTCPFDENAILIRARTLRGRLASVGFEQLQIRYRVFFPKMLHRFRYLEDSLGWLPLGAQYYVRARK